MKTHKQRRNPASGMLAESVRNKCQSKSERGSVCREECGCAQIALAVGGAATHYALDISNPKAFRSEESQTGTHRRLSARVVSAAVGVAEVAV